MCDFPRMSGCNSGKILYNGMSGIFCRSKNDIGGNDRMPWNMAGSGMDEWSCNIPETAA